jgi:hypothetical protein
VITRSFLYKPSCLVASICDCKWEINAADMPFSEIRKMVF